MIRHMALYTLTPKAREEGIERVIAKLDQSVKNMVGRVKGLRGAAVALNLAEDSPHDLVFYSEFEHMEDIPPYLASEIHRLHAEMAEGYVSNKEGIDMEEKGEAGFFSA
ncbi:MAG: Dabb family protein [Gracilibacteraceae bacterium]|jgi:hypothetical protein|nr:Dabb family protein [Gracilibacteraceae bacterium]